MELCSLCRVALLLAGLLAAPAASTTSTPSATSSTGPAWPPAVTNYRDLLNRLSKNTTEWGAAARELRQWMIAHDPDYPLYHLAAPEGWNNDPNGVTFDPHTGLYHRFYQYDPTYSETKKHGTVPRTWGHTVSRDLAHWEDWPGIYADSPWDARGVFSGNCAFNGTDNPDPICIYSNNPCSIGVCATSTDGWITWEKRACMNVPPSKASQTNHDTSIWRDSDTGTWYVLIGGCTYNAPGSGRDPNLPSPPDHVQCQGNAQLWTSADLWNFTYVDPITPGGPGKYWELPYLLPFDEQGDAIDNYHHEQGSQYVLAFGHGNAYWVGAYERSNSSFTVPGATSSGPAWPAPRLSDSPAYYSINPHATDTRGPGGKTRRLVFGWIEGDVSDSVATKAVPYWQSAHSILRTMTVRGPYMVQQPAEEIALLRQDPAHPWSAGPVAFTSGDSGLLPGLRGDCLEIAATFDLTASNASSFGVVLRAGTGANATGLIAAAGGYFVAYTPAKSAIGFGPQRAAGNWFAGMAPQPSGKDTVTLRIFLDRSIVEIYSGGAAFTSRIRLPAATARAALGVDLWAVGGSARLISLQAWNMSSMWGKV